MTQLIETIKENRWRNGKRFLFLNNIDEILAGESADILICVGDKNVILESMNVKANVESLSWQGFIGVVADTGSGDNILPLPKNASADTEAGMNAVLSPIVTVPGQPITVSLNMVAEIYRNNAYYLNQTLISSDFTLLANTCYGIQIKNTSDKDTSVQLIMNISNE
jgi:hypothetical protein